MVIERRGRPKLEITECPRQFKRIYEHEDETIIWTFDLDITDRGPISVEIKYRNGSDTQKYWNAKRKAAKDERRIDRDRRKIESHKPSKKIKPKKK